MELDYPVNLYGYDYGEETGDVLSRHGEFLGAWKITPTGPEEVNGSAKIQFYEVASDKPIFTEEIVSYGSGLHTGMAISKICKRIRSHFPDVDFDKG